MCRCCVQTFTTKKQFYISSQLTPRVHNNLLCTLLDTNQCGLSNNDNR